jgi:hypothetical protein
MEIVLVHDDAERANAILEMQAALPRIRDHAIDNPLGRLVTEARRILEEDRQATGRLPKRGAALFGETGQDRIDRRMSELRLESRPAVPSCRMGLCR